MFLGVLLYLITYTVVNVCCEIDLFRTRILIFSYYIYKLLEIIYVILKEL